MSHPSVGGFPRSKSSGTFLKLFIPTAPSLRGDTVLSFAFRNPLRLLRPVPWTLARGGVPTAPRPAPPPPPPPHPPPGGRAAAPHAPRGCPSGGGAERAGGGGKAASVA